MTTSQIIVLSILTLLTITSFCKSSLSEKYSKQLWNILWFVVSGFSLLISYVSLERNNELSKTNNELLKQIHGKRPEFEQIQGPVYKIKNNGN